MRDAIEKMAIDRFGKIQELVKFQKELAELISIISEYLLENTSDDEVSERLASVIIMSEKFKKFVFDKENIEKIEMEKLMELKKLLQHSYFDN